MARAVSALHEGDNWSERGPSLNVALGFLVQALIILTSPVPGLVSQPETSAADQPVRAVTSAGLAD